MSMITDASQRPASPAAPAAAPRQPGKLRAKLRDIVPPVVAGIFFLGLWEVLVRGLHVSKFILPPPSAIAVALYEDFPKLMHALEYTALIVVVAFVSAVVSGIVLGVLLVQNRDAERIFWPYAVALQVTPMVAIAPMVVIWVGLDRVWLALMIMAWIVAFFPILSNTVLGMKSADRGLTDVFRLYRTSRWQRFRYLQLPSALPFILAGVRISAGLSVIGGVVAEFVGGSGASTGLAWEIVESGNNLDIAGMFAALFVLSAFGLVIWYATAFVQKALLQRWHEIELRD